MQRFIRCYCTARQSYYEILGLPKTATAAEIKKAFITLSKKYHPDLTGSNEAATKKFVAVKEAYDTLRDPDKRQVYDSQMSGGGGYPYNGYSNQSNPYQAGGNPFQNNSQFEQKWKNGRWEFTYRRNNPSGQQQFTQDDFERIWREFQRKTQDPRNASYDNMFKEHRQRVWDDFSKARAEAWRKRSEEHAKKYPFDNMQFNPALYINWDKFNKYLIIYVVIFFIIGVLQSMWTGDKENEAKQKQKVVYSERKYEPTPRERLQEMIYRPPPSTSETETPWYEDRPPSSRPPGI
jgi:curved DNA-binding protein CbpA